MAFQAEHYPGEIHLYAATLENPQDFEPTFHVITSSFMIHLPLPALLLQRPELLRNAMLLGRVHFQEVVF